MIEKVNTFLNTTTAFKIIALLEKRKVKGKGFMYVTDPFVPTKHLHIHGQGIMEPNQLGFGTGTWLDFYAYAKRQDYATAAKEILAKVDKEDILSADDLHNVTAALFANRLVLETLLRNRSNVLQAGYAQRVRLFVRSRSTQPEFCKNIVFCLKGDVLNYFSDLIFQFFHPSEMPSTTFNVNEAYMCVPYFINHHMINHLDVYSIKQLPKFKARLSFFDSKFSFSNIWSAPLGAIHMDVFQNYEVLLNVAERHINYGAHVGFSSVSFTPKGSFHELYTPIDGVYYPQPEEDIEDLLDISTVFPRFKISSTPSFLDMHSKDLLDVLTFAKNRLEEYYVEDQYYSPRISELIGAVKDQELYIAEFLELAEENKWETLVNILKAIQNNNQLYEPRSYVLFKTHENYVLQQNSNSNRRPVTNFIFRIKQKVMFRHDSEQYYDTLLIFNKKEYQMFIPHSKARDAGKLAQEIHNVFISNIPSNSTQIDIEIPTIYDVQIPRILSVIFLNEAKKAKTILGINRLGLSEDRETWNLFDGIVDRNGYRKRFNFVKPTSILLNNFFSRPAHVAYEKDSDNREGRLLICAFVCNFLRFFYQNMFASIYVHHTYWRQMLALLSEFGQVEVVKFQRNFKPSDATELIGLPFVCAGVHEIHAPGFILSTGKKDSVWMLPQASASEEEMLKMSTIFRRIMIRVVQAALAGSQSDYLRKLYDSRDLEYMTYVEMAKEGAEILALLGIVKWDIEPVIPELKQFISELPESSTFYVTLRKSKLGNCSVKLIKNELLQNRVDFEYHEDKHSFVVKKHQLLGIA